MGLKFQKMTSGVRIFLENEDGDRQELLDPSNELDLRNDTLVSSKWDKDSRKLRKCVLFSKLKKCRANEVYIHYVLYDVIR